MKYRMIVFSLLIVAVFGSCYSHYNNYSNYYRNPDYIALDATNIRGVEVSKEAFNEEVSKARAKQRRPLLVLKHTVKLNNFGTPYAHIEFYNDTDKNITAFTVDFSCYDAFGNPVRYRRNNIYRGINQDITISSKRMDELNWRLGLQRNTRKINSIIIHKIMFDDGTSWRRGQKYYKR